MLSLKSKFYSLGAIFGALLFVLWLTYSHASTEQPSTKGPGTNPLCDPSWQRVGSPNPGYDIVIEEEDGTTRIDPDKVMQSAIELGASPDVKWNQESVEMSPHPVQKAPEPGERNDN